VLTYRLVEFHYMVVVEAVKHLAPSLAVADEPRSAQGPKLVGNGGLGHAEALREVADAVLVAAEQGKEAQPGGIGEDGEEFPHALGFFQIEGSGHGLGSVAGGVGHGAELGIVVRGSGRTWIRTRRARGHEGKKASGRKHLN